jgi:hypothetical protein
VVVQEAVAQSQFYRLEGPQVVVRVDVHEEQVEEADNLAYLVHE